MCILGKCKFSASEKKSLCPHVPFFEEGFESFPPFQTLPVLFTNGFLQVLTLNDLELPSTDEVREISTIYFILQLILERQITWSEFWNSIPL